MEQGANLMSTYLITTITYATITLIFPIVPAYLLYRALPAGRKTRVSGPWKGLNVQLTGAFAGYFLLFITMVGFISLRPEPVDSRYDIWEVKGKLGLEGRKSSLKEGDFRISSVPPSVKIYPDGTFTMAVAAENSKRFPTILFESEGYETYPLDLNETEQNEIQVVSNGTLPQLKLKPITLARETQFDLSKAQAPQEVKLEQEGK
jgi:hypothetical protein